MRLRVARKVLYQWQRWFTVTPRAARGTARWKRLHRRMQRKVRKHRARRWVRVQTETAARRRWLRCLKLFRRFHRGEWCVQYSGRIVPWESLP